jgi:GT2 family glycosyltransferase
LGGFRRGFEGAQDYDFVLRFAERAGLIEHVPKVLYHWRVRRGSTAAAMAEKDYVTAAACRALSERLDRMGRRGHVTASDFKGCFRVQQEIVGEPLVSIVIPTAGRSASIRGKVVDLLASCLRGIRSRTDYPRYEVIVVDNDDLREETRRAVQQHDCRLVHYSEPFNVARKMNLGATHAGGEHLLFLNDDVEVIDRDWLRNMLSLVQHPGVGVVGAKLFFEDGTLQHVGIAFDDDGLPDHISRGHPGDESGYFFSSVGTRNYLAVTGACVMTPRDLFWKLGGFDEAFAVNYNDIDYCLRAHEAGHRAVFTPHARLYHFESKTRERVVAQTEIDMFRQRWADVTKADPYYSSLFHNRPPDFALRLG